MVRGKKAPSANLAGSKSKTLTIKFYATLSIFFALLTLHFLYPKTAFLIRLLLGVLLGILLYNLYANSREIKILLFIILGVLLMFPKIAIRLDYLGAKSCSDAWAHMSNILSYNQIEHFRYINYYTVFPIVYNHILFLSGITGIKIHYALTLYYLIINLLTAIALYKICDIITTMEKLNSKKNYLPIIGVLAYSIVLYPNSAILRELPQATGLLSMCLAFYVLLKIQKQNDHRFVIIGILVALLSLSHPFASIFMTCFFVLYSMLKLLCKGHSFIPTYHLILMPFILVLLYYSILASFEYSVEWFKTSFSLGIDILFGLLSEPGPYKRFKEVSMDIKYSMMSERFFYGLNWALPVSMGLSYLLVLGILIVKNRNIQILKSPNIFTNTTALMSTTLSGFALIFSFSEYAFSRYFGTYAVLISIPTIAYFINESLKKTKIIKILMISIIVLTTIAILTDWDFLPSFQMGDLYRERAIGSEITSVPELYVAQFLSSKISQEYSTIYTDMTYASTINFFSRAPVTFNYPATKQDFELLKQAGSYRYILIRELKFFYQFENMSSGLVFYSNGDVYGVFITAATS